VKNENPNIAQPDSSYYRVRLSLFSGRINSSAGSTPKRIGEFGDNLKPRVAHALFQLAKVSAVHVRLVGKILLRYALCVSEPAEIGRESLPEVPRVHPANGTACRLLTHRFKATK